MDIKEIQYLLGVLKYGSINRASKMLYVSQPNLSNSIKKIENELNVKIFNRTSHGVVLTKDGQELIESFTIISQQFSYILSKYQKNSNSKTKFIILHNEFISLSNSIFKFKKFYNLNKLTFDIQSYRLNSLFKTVASSSVPALGIIAIPQTDIFETKKVALSNSLMFSELFRTHSSLIVGNLHPLFHKDSVTEQDISNCNINCYFAASYINACKLFGSPQNDKEYIVHSKENLLSLISISTICGIGCNYLESPLYLSCEHLRYIPIIFKKLDIVFATIHKSDIILDDIYKLFIKYLKNEFDKNYIY